uniref:Uncharacterized protein n=1 Tax=Ixodes ricinus TaxID=34613 RepID=A0A6B0UVE6_IXORI
MLNILVVISSILYGSRSILYLTIQGTATVLFLGIFMADRKSVIPGGGLEAGTCGRRVVTGVGIVLSKFNVSFKVQYTTGLIYCCLGSLIFISNTLQYMFRTDSIFRLLTLNFRAVRMSRKNVYFLLCGPRSTVTRCWSACQSFLLARWHVV